MPRCEIERACEYSIIIKTTKFSNIGSANLMLSSRVPYIGSFKQQFAKKHSSQFCLGANDFRLQYSHKAFGRYSISNEPIRLSRSLL